jgi:polar amino acid transport system substrate-binding protein
LISTAFKEVGFEVEYQFYPWLRCEANVREGVAYATFPYKITPERQVNFDFSAPIAKAVAKLFFLKSKITEDIYWKALADLKQYKIGGTYGYWYHKQFKAEGIDLDLADNDALNIKKLHAGRFDLLATNELVGWFYIKQLFPDEINSFATLKKPFDVSDYRLMVSKTYPNAAAITKKFNAGLQKIKDKGIYSAILKKHHIDE